MLESVRLADLLSEEHDVRIRVGLGDGGDERVLIALELEAAVIAFAIKIDSPGPVLFGQLREGYHGRAFKIWKFRTMHYSWKEGGLIQTSRHDSRVTRVGRILRRLSLDELPQLMNVAKGEMSIVGPRPHAVGMTCLGLPMTETTLAF